MIVTVKSTVTIRESVTLQVDVPQEYIDRFKGNLIAAADEFIFLNLAVSWPALSEAPRDFHNSHMEIHTTAPGEDHEDEDERYGET